MKPPTVPVFMSKDPAVRKLMPVATGFYKYFPDAIKVVSWVSRAANEQHNPGEPLYWNKDKSKDEEDACARHQLDALTGAPPEERLKELGDLAHLAQRAWRAMAALQRECDAKRAAVSK